jgi:molecular chaperone Hsp33
MPDKLHRFFIENLQVRGEWVSLSNAWQEVQKTADYPQPVRHVLGEALVAISLLAESLKFDGSLVLQIRGTSPVTMLVVQATADGAIRGIAHWDNEISDDASFNELFGAGTMVISVEPGTSHGERYQSLVSLQGASLAECFCDYFAQSEQLKTKMWLAVNDETAAGLLLQSLPSKEDIHEAQTDNEHWNHARILADTLSHEQGKQELLTLDVESLLYRLYHEEDIRLYEANPLRFECSCSQQKIESTIYSLGKEEAKSILEEQGSISIDCEFCNTHYQLDKVDVSRIFHQKGISVSNLDVTQNNNVH